MLSLVIMQNVCLRLSPDLSIYSLLSLISDKQSDRLKNFGLYSNVISFERLFGSELRWKRELTGVLVLEAAAGR